MQTLPIRTDLVVQTAGGDILALVEVTNREHFSPDVASALRRNLIAHGRANWWSRFFLIVSQDVGYLWDQNALPSVDAPPPTVSFPMTSVVERYLPSFAGGARLSGSQLELAVSQWLWDIANGVEDRPRQPEAALAATDFLRLLNGGTVDTEIDL